MITTELDLLNVKKRVRGATTTLYWRLGTPVIRKSRNRNVSGKKWKRTPKREQAICKFTSGKRLITAFQYVLGALSPWLRAARLYGTCGQTGENLFFSRNHGYFSADGSGVEDFRHFKLSLGQLLLPAGLRLTREGNTCTLEWEVQEEQLLASPDDLLHVGFIREDEPDGLTLVDLNRVRRGDGKAVFTLDGGQECRIHLYPFFGREDNTEYSDSDYFKCEEVSITSPENTGKVENETFPLPGNNPVKVIPGNGNDRISRLRFFTRGVSRSVASLSFAGEREGGSLLRQVFQPIAQYLQGFVREHVFEIRYFLPGPRDTALEHVV